jgi:predicted DNA-binding protein (MmcQ/YjbR family)
VADVLAEGAEMPAYTKEHACSHMTLEEFNDICRSLPSTTSVIQWRGAHVWKIGGKMFAIGRSKTDQVSVTFKVSEIAYEILKAQPGLRPAPYLASRGLKWIQHFAPPGLTDSALQQYIQDSYVMTFKDLPTKAQIALGQNENLIPSLKG